jgi:hypothetical protein
MGFLNSLVTIDETLIHIYDPKTKENPRNGGKVVSRCPKKFRT